MQYHNDSEKIYVHHFEEKAGFYTSAKRSRNMSRIMSKNSKPELILRKSSWAQDIRVPLHDKSLSSTLDIVIKKYKLAIFVDGELWYGYNSKNNLNRIRSNLLFWIPKIELNM